MIRRHTGARTVSFTGFAPGFAYMSSDDPGLDVPRRKSPRVRIPRSSVALASRFSVYRPGPGGWQLIGRTTTRMWDLARNNPAYAGARRDRVHFPSGQGRRQSVPTCPGRAGNGEDRTPVCRSCARNALRCWRMKAGPDEASQGDVRLRRAGSDPAFSAVNEVLGEMQPMHRREIVFGGVELRADKPCHWP